MDTCRRSGIAAGILFIVATAAGVLSLFTLGPVNAPDYLARIAPNEQKVLAGALLVFIMGWSGAGIAVSMYPVLRKHGEGLALGAAGFRIIEGVFLCISAVLILLLVGLSRDFVTAGPAVAEEFQRLGALLKEARTGVRDVAGLLAWCIGASLYYWLFFRTRLVPRWLSVWGLAGLLPTVAAILLVLFRQLSSASTLHTLMNLPLALQEMVLAAWLIARGFNPSAPAVQEKRAA